MYYKNIVYIFLSFGFNATSQTINLEFPYFAGKTYEFKIVQGEKHIVIKNDTIPIGGKVHLNLPEKYKGYKGMVMWYLTNSKTGGGLEMVLNNEDFSVTCLDSVPTNQNIVYHSSNENNFINTNFHEQQIILAQHDAMLFAKKAYSKTHELYPIFEKEYNRVSANYSMFFNKLKETNLYAARFREITNLTMGIGSIITEDEYLKAENINEILVNKLNYEDLYTSNHWSAIINSFVQLQVNVIKNESTLIRNSKEILKRISSNQVYTDFVISLTKELSKVGKDEVITALTQEINNSKKILNYNGILSIYQEILTRRAPDLQIVEFSNVENTESKNYKVLDLAKQKSKFSLVVFYQSGCGHCEETILTLQRYYKDLTNKSINIISLSADTEEHVFVKTSLTFPWKDKYCDFQGFNGINFKNYEVIGTPTMFLVDNNGNIIDKFSRVESLSEKILFK